MYKISEIDKNNLGKVSEVIYLDDVSELAAAICDVNWSPGLFRENIRRIANFTQTDLFVMDVDEGCTLEQAKEIFKEYKHIIATTRSHQKEKSGKVVDRFRVVLFLNQYIVSDDHFKQQFKHMQSKYSFIDEACKDASRFFYPCKTVYSINSSGKDVLVVEEETELDKALATPTPTALEKKGDLMKPTLDFLLHGAAPGHRHNALVKAVMDMREQGYDMDEIADKLEDLSERTGDTTFSPSKDKQMRYKLSNLATRPLKLEYRQKGSENALIAKQDFQEPVSAASLIDETFEYLENPDQVLGEPTGIKGLDAMLGGGLRSGELTVLMAQAKTGKNAFLHYVLHKMLSRGIPFGYASRELTPSTEVIPNLLSIELGINAWKTPPDNTFKTQARKAAQSWPLFFAPGYGVMFESEIEFWFKSLKKQNIQYFLFDHYHYALEAEDHATISRTVRKLKTLTKELDIHLIMIVQPRSLREGESLSLNTLRGGSTIGQALDNLLIMERVKDAHLKNVSRLKLEVARHRLATPGKIFLQYDKQTTRFDEIELALKDKSDAYDAAISKARLKYTQKYTIN